MFPKESAQLYLLKRTNRLFLLILNLPQLVGFTVPVDFSLYSGESTAIHLINIERHSPSSFAACGNLSDRTLGNDSANSTKKLKLSANALPSKLSHALLGHSKAVNALNWSPSNGHLLASASMDKSTCIWNISETNETPVRIFKSHNAAVNDVKWSPKGISILSCGYDSSSRLIDVEKGIQTQIFKESQVVKVVKFHPRNSSLFMSGGSGGYLRLWDVRTTEPGPVHEFFIGTGSVLDLDFINSNEFVSSCDVTGSNISENSIVVWDISRQVPLSHQVYVEAYTCPSVRCNPREGSFVAQSNGNYVAIFSSKHPFRLDKYKRYEGHRVDGFPIKCNFSKDGMTLASGSSDGRIYFYNSRTTHLLKKIKAYKNHPCIDVAFNPCMPNVIASCSWNGHVTIFE